MEDDGVSAGGVSNAEVHDVGAEDCCVFCDKEAKLEETAGPRFIRAAKILCVSLNNF